MPNLIVMSSPSGGGKSTIANYLMKLAPNLRFSVSATTRPIRPGEIDGKDYHFLTRSQFQSQIDEGGLIEYEEIFGNYYGTLRSVIEKSLQEGNKILFDVDVKGARSLKSAFPDRTLTIFIKPPSKEILESRLRKRGTEDAAAVAKRMARVEEEMQYESDFDFVIINDKLQDSFAAISQLARDFSLV